MTRRHFSFHFAISLLLAALCGCSGSHDSGAGDGDPDGATPPFAGQNISIAVIDDPAIAEALRRLAGEWSARTGATWSVEETSADELTASGALQADVVIYPSGLLGTLATQGTLRPLSEDQLASERLDFQDIFTALRRVESDWGSQTLALPLGSPTLVCFYRRDLFERFGKSPPKTWQEYGRLAAFFDGRSNLQDAAPAESETWFGAAEPTASGEAALALLARAAGYARHPDYFSALFDQDTMAPQIEGPPFVRALEEIIAAQQFGPGDGMEVSLEEARQAALAGRCALAISWLTAGDEANESSLDVAVAELPGATEVFHPAEGKMVPTALRRPPVLCFSGRLASVSAGAKHPEAAFETALSLAGDWSARVSGASRATTLFRQSQVAAPRPWVGGVDNALATEYARALERTLSKTDVLCAARIPGHRRYLDTLDRAVRQALSGETSPREALGQAADEWRRITEEFGVERQKEAYRKSVVRLF